MNPDGREGEEKVHIVQWTENIAVSYCTRNGSIFNKRGEKQNIKKKNRKPKGEKVKLKFSGRTVIQADTAKHSMPSLSLELSDNNPCPHSQTQGTQPQADLPQLLRQWHSLLSWTSCLPPRVWVYCFRFCRRHKIYLLHVQKCFCFCYRTWAVY